MFCIIDSHIKECILAEGSQMWTVAHTIVGGDFKGCFMVCWLST